MARLMAAIVEQLPASERPLGDNPRARARGKRDEALAQLKEAEEELRDGENRLAPMRAKFAPPNREDVPDISDKRLVEAEETRRLGRDPTLVTPEGKGEE